MRFRTLTSHITATVLFVLAAHVATLGAQTERRTITGDRVALYNLAGHLRVQPGSGSDVVVDITRGGRDAAQLKLATGTIRGWETLRIVYPSNQIVYAAEGFRGRTQLRVNSDGTFDDHDNDGWNSRDRVEIRDSGSGIDAHADLTVSVPRGQRIALHWGVGQATVTNVDGDIRVSVAAATLDAEHTRGRLALSTGSGRVTVNDANGDVDLDTGSGQVSVTGVHGESLGIDTGSGSVTGSDVDVKTLKVDVGSGGIRLGQIKAPHVAVDAGSGGTDLEFLTNLDQITVDAGSGPVTLRLPATQSADVDIETGSGGIDSDFPVQTSRVERNHLRGRIGDGHGRIRIESGSGHVRLLKN